MGEIVTNSAIISPYTFGYFASIADRDEVDLIVDLIVNAVLALVFFEVVEPRQDRPFDLDISACIRVNVDVIEHRENFSGHLI